MAEDSAGLGFGLAGFPVIKVYFNWKELNQYFSQARTAEYLIDFAMIKLENAALDTMVDPNVTSLYKRVFQGQPFQQQVEKNESVISAFVTLTDAIFDTLIIKNELWYVVFVIAQCQPCRVQEKMISEAIETLSGKFKLGILDIYANPMINQRFKLGVVPNSKFIFIWGDYKRIWNGEW